MKKSDEQRQSRLKKRSKIREKHMKQLVIKKTKKSSKFPSKKRKLKSPKGTELEVLITKCLSVEKAAEKMLKEDKPKLIKRKFYQTIMA